MPGGPDHPIVGEYVIPSAPHASTHHQPLLAPTPSTMHFAQYQWHAAPGRRRCRICLQAELERADDTGAGTAFSTSSGRQQLQDGGTAAAGASSSSANLSSGVVDDGELICPCLCRGSQQYVHRHCLDVWRAQGAALNATAFTHCPLCSFEYRLKYVQVLSSSEERDRRVQNFRQRVLKKGCWIFWLSQLVMVAFAVCTGIVDQLALGEELKNAFPAWMRRYEWEENYLFDRKGVYYFYGVAEFFALFVTVYSVYGWYTILVRICARRPGAAEEAEADWPAVSQGSSIEQDGGAARTEMTHERAGGNHAASIRVGDHDRQVNEQRNANVENFDANASNVRQNFDQHSSAVWIGSRAFVVRPAYNRFTHRFQRWWWFRPRGPYRWGGSRPAWRARWGPRVAPPVAPWGAPPPPLLFPALFCCPCPIFPLSCCCLLGRAGRNACVGSLRACWGRVCALCDQGREHHMLVLFAIALTFCFSFVGFVTGAFLLLSSAWQVYLEYLRLQQLEVLSHHYVVEDLSRFHNGPNFPANLVALIQESHEHLHAVRATEAGSGSAAGRGAVSRQGVTHQGHDVFSHALLLPTMGNSTGVRQHEFAQPPVFAQGTIQHQDAAPLTFSANNSSSEDEGHTRPSAPPAEGSVALLPGNHATTAEVQAQLRYDLENFARVNM